MTYKTDQENFWAGNFGDDYIDRNKSKELFAANLNFFTKALNCADKVNSVIEFGANIGMNLRALKMLYPDQQQSGVEINQAAADKLKEFVGDDNVFVGSILDYAPEGSVDLALIKTVLIHINPDMLPAVYDKLYEASNRYILVCEYYNPSPMTVNYRGHNERLFKRDFCGEMLDRFSDLRLVDYGFAYKRDVFSQDDITWFLMEKCV
jgi:pseudaminic acid biosynthesis-associated methylase|tara:strand:- start:52202 stop:52822 length:621 start_codon:yes stop_codon:yes gene_type:complete